ncbi:MAG: COX15/CtaA family protein [Bradymonadaceae bacterium]
MFEPPSATPFTAVISETDSPTTFERALWAFIGYLLLVVLFGAWVRISFSGAGCGQHWPTCQGAVIPPSPRFETLVEYTHRLSSGLLGLMDLGLLAWAWRRDDVEDRVVRGLLATTFFVVVEALIGAGLVLAELVEHDASVARAVVVGFHLANTFLLTAAAALSAWWASGGSTPNWTGTVLERGAVGVLGVLVLIGMTGAVTALGDTLFPIDPTVGEGWVQKLRTSLSPAEHFLVRLRVVHPLLAVLGAVALAIFANEVRTGPAGGRAGRPAAALLGLVVLEVAAGFLNLMLGAPGWLQIVHLLLAQLVWITAVLTTNEVMADARTTPG